MEQKGEEGEGSDLWLFSEIQFYSYKNGTCDTPSGSESRPYVRLCSPSITKHHLPSPLANIGSKKRKSV